MACLKVFTEYKKNSIIKFNDYITFLANKKSSFITISELESLSKLKSIKNTQELTPIIGIEIVLNNLEYYIIAKSNKGVNDLIKLHNTKDFNYLLDNQNDLIIILGKPNLNFIIELSEKDLKEKTKGIKELLIGIYKGHKFYNSLLITEFPNSKKVYLDDVYYLNKQDKTIYKNYLELINEELDEFNSEYKEYKENEFILELINIDLQLIFSDNYIMKLEQNSLEKIKEKINKKYNIKNEKILNKIDSELKLIESKNFSDFFYIISDLVNNFLIKNEILYSNRGSAGGSLVLFLLSITLLNPIKYKLKFERFINEFRKELPDIDLDIQSDKIDDVIKYLISKYSSKKIAKFINYNEFHMKSLCRKTLNKYGVEEGSIKLTMKNIFNEFRNEQLTYELLEYILKNKEKYKLSDREENSLEKMYKTLNSLFIYYPKLYSNLKLIGLKFQSSVHTSGILLINENIESHFPILKKENEVNIIALDKNAVEKIDIIKLDLLSSKILKVLKTTMTKANVKYTEFYDVNNLDKEVLDYMNTGSNQFLFHFSSDIGKTLLENSKLNNFNDLINLISCNRPGPLTKNKKTNKSVVDIYFNNKDKINNNDYIEKSKYFNILSNSYDCLLFQEQVLEITKKFAGYTLAEAETKIRKNISSKNTKKIQKIKKDFITRSIENGNSEKASNEMFLKLMDFSKYSFNKSHAAIYAFISYKTAYMKYYHKEIFTKEFLKEQTRSKTTQIVNKNSNEIKKFSINSTPYYSFVSDKNILGFQYIKNLTIEDYKIIKQNRPIDSISTLKNKIKDKILIDLIKIGSFDFISTNRLELIKNNFMNINEDYNMLKWNESLKITFELEVLKLTLGQSLDEVNCYYDQQEVISKGIITNLTIKKDKNQNEFATLKVRFKNNELYVIVFNEIYKRNIDKLKTLNIIKIKGVYNAKFNNIKIKEILN